MQIAGQNACPTEIRPDSKTAQFFDRDKVANYSAKTQNTVGKMGRGGTKGAQLESQIDSQKEGLSRSDGKSIDTNSIVSIPWRIR